MVSVNAWLAKYSEEKRESLSEKYQINWEYDSCVKACRICGETFGFVTRKHHCRFCGGIYCDSCDPQQGMMTARRKCLGCIRGLTPGPEIFAIVRSLKQQLHNSGLQQKIDISCTSLPLVYDALYDENFIREGNKPPHRSGYFQFTNKSENACCLKVITAASLIYNEICRPSYLAIPPNDSVYSTFHESVTVLQVLVLFDNPFPTREGDCYAGNSVSPSAKVENFRKVNIYRVHCDGKNVFLKHKELGIVKAREGNNAKITKVATGFFSGLISRKERPSEESINTDQLDFTTIVEHVEELYISS